MDPNNPNIKSRSTPQWALYQREAFWAPNEDRNSLFNTGTYPRQFRAQHKLTALRPRRG